MTPRKLNRAFVLAGITMPTVRAHIERNLSAVAPDLLDATAKQLAAVIVLHHAAYTQGRASCEAAIADDAVWVGGGVDKLIPLAALKALEIDSRSETVRRPYTHSVYPHAASIRDATTGGYIDRAEFEARKMRGVATSYYSDEMQSTTHITLDYTERT